MSFAIPGPIALRDLKAQLIQALSLRYEMREAEAVARILLAHVSGDAWQRLEGHTLWSGADLQAIETGLEALLSGQPIQHVTGWGHFYGREFKAGPGALIPRGETEELMLWGLDVLQKSAQHAPLRVLDIGTGTGCIPISLYLEWAALKPSSPLVVSALEPYPAAVTLARANAAHFEVALDVQVQDLFDTDAASFTELDLLLSNPPYIPLRERADLDRQVRDFEPGTALFVPDDDPLRFYAGIAQRGLHWLRPGGWLLFECHTDYTEAVAALMQEMGYAAVNWRRDIQGRPRLAGGSCPS